MIYLLDRNALAAAMWGEPDPILERLRAAAAEPAAVAVSGIVLFEIRYAIARSRRKRQDAERLRTLLSGIQVVPFDANDAAVAGELRAALEAARTPMGLSELFTAAQALRLGATVATTNPAEFAAVPGLTLADWTSVPTGLTK
jgi:tRNA(fMet)-specific endonuclease VapC